MQRRSWPLLLLIALTLLAWPAAAFPGPATAQGCTDEAELVSQELDPASGSLAPEATFTVEWTLRNTGECTWNRDYRLLFVSGERMGSARTARLRTQVAPGATLTLTLDLTAPAEPGEYRGLWRLRGPDGQNFGPELIAEVRVAEGAGLAETGEVTLPEVLVFGGRGGGGSPDDLSFCLELGGSLEQPSLVFDEDDLQYRYANLYLCGFAPGTALTVTVTNPDGDIFFRNDTVGEPVTYVDEAENEYTGTVNYIALRFHARAPSGDWTVHIAAEEGLSLETVLAVPEPLPFQGDPYPMLENWPAAPIDPFSAADGCNYLYQPGDSMNLAGAALPPNATLQLGVYQERLYEGYRVDEMTVATDESGAFLTTYTAPEPGSYSLIVLQQVVPEGFHEDGLRYEMGFEEVSAFSCFTVAAPAEEEAYPLRLALTQGEPGAADVLVLTVATGAGYYPTYNLSECDAAEPAWWPDGEWVIYQSNCGAEDYDLYAYQIDTTFTIPEEEKLIRLTNTPELDETEPHVDPSGLIVYRQAPAGTPLDESGELWVLDGSRGELYDLGLTGRAPAWSPDGSRIAFMSDLEGTWLVYVYDVLEESLWVASERCPTHCRFPAWSPDGEQIIYSVAASTEDLTPSGLWIVSAEGERPRRWLSGPYDRPTWSAQGWIAFTGPNGIYRAKAAARRPSAEPYLYHNTSGPVGAPGWSY
ncbi:MAG TPA: NBR1-Ig-like domain-containing protein [Caldilineaceae bacterium]|nr:NBR1-Ig-like domain-containing protein [Caldilineaceae bacterium]